MKVWVATIEHRHGTNVYVAETEEALLREIKAYVESWWAERFGDPPIAPMPENASDAISLYFSAGETDEYYNWFGEMEVAK